MLNILSLSYIKHMLNFSSLFKNNSKQFFKQEKNILLRLAALPGDHNII